MSKKRICSFSKGFKLEAIERLDPLAQQSQERVIDFAGLLLVPQSATQVRQQVKSETCWIV